MDRVEIAKAIHEKIERDAWAILSAGMPKPPKTTLRASRSWPGYVIEEERGPWMICTCPKSAMIHRAGCPAMGL